MHAMVTDAAHQVILAEENAIVAFPLRRFRRFAHIEAYVQQLVTHPWWSARFPDAPLEIVLQRRSRSATYSAAGCSGAGEWIDATMVDRPGFIWLIDGHGWGLETVLHEFAHLAAGPATGHGAEFRDALGELWRHEAGIEAWAALQDGFASAGLTAFDHRGAEPHDGFPRPRPHP